MREVKVGQTYRHFKGTLHKIVAIAIHSESLEKLVIYTHDDQIWQDHMIYLYQK